jgi:hypothetical protein
LEKKGIPTVTVVTTPFVELIKASLKEQGVEQMSLVVVEHPIAGHKLAGIQKKVEIAFPDVLKACTIWQPK